MNSRFDGKTVSEICIQICSHVLEFYANRYPRGTRDRTVIKRHLLTIQTRLGILGRMASSEFATSPHVETFCVLVLTNSLAGMPIRRDVFDLSPTRLGLVSADTVLLFLSTLLREGVECIRGHLRDVPRLKAFADECSFIFEEIFLEIRPFLRTSPFVGDGILESRTIFLRLSKRG